MSYIDIYRNHTWGIWATRETFCNVVCILWVFEAYLSFGKVLQVPRKNCNKCVFWSTWLKIWVIHQNTSNLEIPCWICSFIKLRKYEQQPLLWKQTPVTLDCLERRGVIETKETTIIRHGITSSTRCFSMSHFATLSVNSHRLLGCFGICQRHISHYKSLLNPYGGIYLQVNDPYPCKKLDDVRWCCDLPS